jgi:hypothetical protein
MVTARTEHKLRVVVVEVAVLPAQATMAATQMFNPVPQQFLAAGLAGPGRKRAVEPVILVVYRVAAVVAAWRLRIAVANLAAMAAMAK